MDLKKKRFHLEVTGRCNIECKYCYNSDFNDMTMISNELSIDEIKSLIRQAVAIGCTTFIFSGGEPFLNPNFVDILKCCPENSKASAITNASLIDKKMIESLKGIKQLKELKVSWDGFDAHDKVRKGSKSQQVIEAIELIKENLPSCRIIINTMMNKYSSKEIFKLYEKLKELGIDYWRIDMPFNSGRYTKTREDISNMDFKEMISIYKKLLEVYFKDNKPMIMEIFNVYKSQISSEGYFEFDLDVHPCSYYNNTVTVRPNGDITFCPSLAFPIENWRNTRNLEEAVLSAQKHSYFNVSVGELKGCSKCRYLKLCGGGCRADAITWLKDEYEVDPISCSIMPMIEEEIIPILPENEKRIFRGLININGDLPNSRKNIFELLNK